jgi:hypothetical protein
MDPQQPNGSAPAGAHPARRVESGSKCDHGGASASEHVDASSAAPNGASVDGFGGSVAADSGAVMAGPAADLGSTPPQTDPSPNAHPTAQSSDAQPSVDASLPPLPRTDPQSTLWPERLMAVAASFYEWLSQPRVRLTVTGVMLLVIGGLILPNSVWTLPLVIIGALMVVIAWLGCRLDGRFAIQWGEAGTQLEFRAKIKAAQPARATPTRTSPSSHQLVRTPEAEEGAEVIDGEAHTIEIDVAELEALIAAVETTKAEQARHDASGHAKREFRIAHPGAGSSQASP